MSKTKFFPFTQQKPFRRKKRSGGSGFTLIELLIVIAIILILIAIALPNFLEAQIRARVTKVKGEIRTVAIALNSYFLDFRVYPGRQDQNYTGGTRLQNGLTWLTSPIAYIKSLPEDPFPVTFSFDTGGDIEGPYTYFYTGVDTDFNITNVQALHPHGGDFLRMWLIASAGPDSPGVEVSPGDGCPTVNKGGEPQYSTYAPTNGTKSKGDIWIFGGETRWMGIDITSRGCLGILSALKTAPRPGVVYDGQRIWGRFPEGQSL